MMQKNSSISNSECKVMITGQEMQETMLKKTYSQKEKICRMIKRILAIFVTLGIFLCLVFVSNHILDNKLCHAKYDEFFNNPEEYDVIFLGSSHGINGILPMELWDEYHMTSYNFSDYGQWIPVDYWLLQEVLQYHTPKLVVLDTYSLEFDEKYSEGHIAYVHNAFDGFPISFLKWESVKDLFPREKRMDFLVPFSVYHSKWDSIEKDYFLEENRMFPYAKGADESALFEAPTNNDLILATDNGGNTAITEADDIEAYGKEYLIKILNLCQENDIEILLTTTPYVVNDDYMRANNQVYAIAEKYGVNFYNGLTENILDFQTDMLDYRHLNSSGARKWTHYLGDYIASHYDLSSYETGEIFEKWDSQYNDQYMKYKAQIASERTHLEDYLMLIADRNFSACIYIYDTSDVKNRNEVESLLNNLAKSSEIGFGDAGASSQYMLIIDNEKDCVDKFFDIKEQEKVDTSFGVVSFKNNELHIDGSENYLIDRYEDGTIPNIQIVLINNKNNEIVDVARFCCDMGNIKKNQ